MPCAHGEPPIEHIDFVSIVMLLQEPGSAPRWPYLKVDKEDEETRQESDKETEQQPEERKSSRVLVTRLAFHGSVVDHWRPGWLHAHLS